MGQERIWAALPAGYKSWKVNSENSAFESHIKNHQRYQKLILWWKDMSKSFEPSPSTESTRCRGGHKSSEELCIGDDGMRVPMALTTAQATPLIVSTMCARLSPMLSGRSARVSVTMMS